MIYFQFCKITQLFHLFHSQLPSWNQFGSVTFEPKLYKLWMHLYFNQWEAISIHYLPYLASAPLSLCKFNQWQRIFYHYLKFFAILSGNAQRLIVQFCKWLKIRIRNAIEVSLPKFSNVFHSSMNNCAFRRRNPWAMTNFFCSLRFQKNNQLQRNNLGVLLSTFTCLKQDLEHRVTLLKMIFGTKCRIINA